jgi:CBS domain-containing protein
MSQHHKIEKVLTQSAVLAWVVKHKHELGPVLTKTVSELNLGIKPVVSITPDAPAIEALKLMAKYKVSAVAVVDADGTLFTNISAKDLRVSSIRFPSDICSFWDVIIHY